MYKGSMEPPFLEESQYYLMIAEKFSFTKTILSVLITICRSLVVKTLFNCANYYPSILSASKTFIMLYRLYLTVKYCWVDRAA